MRRENPLRARTYLGLAACAAALAACASPAGVPSPEHGVPVAEPAPERDLHVDATLVSGERLPGSSAACDVALFADKGREAVPLSSVREITRNDDRETVTVRLADGSTRRGVLETNSFSILPAGAMRARVLAANDVRALRVTPRIRIEGSGDAWWDLSLVNACGCDTDNTGGRLTVKRIDPEQFNLGNGGPWSTVRLAREIEPRGDFDLAAGLAWSDDGTGPRAMQNLYVTLFDTAGNEIVCAGHHDAWDGTTGSRYTRLGGAEKQSGYGTQPACGRADLRIARASGVLRVSWNGEEMRSCQCAAPVARVVVQVDYYPWRGWDALSVLGAATLERLEIR
jgi:hypothetical protein